MALWIYINEKRVENRKKKVRSEVILIAMWKMPREVVSKARPNGFGIHTVKFGRVSLWPLAGATRKFSHFLFYTFKKLSYFKNVSWEGILKRYLFFILFIWLCQVSLLACGIFRMQRVNVSCSMWHLVPQPGMEPEPLALGVQHLRGWTTRKVPLFYTLMN